MGYGASLAKVSNKKTNKEYLVEHAWASDYDKDSCDTYKLNVKPKNIYCMPVEEFFPKIDQGVIKLENLTLLPMASHVMILVMLESKRVLRENMDLCIVTA